MSTEMGDVLAEVKRLDERLDQHIVTEERRWTQLLTAVEANTAAIRKHAEIVADSREVVDSYKKVLVGFGALRWLGKFLTWVASLVGALAAYHHYVK